MSSSKDEDRTARDTAAPVRRNFLFATGIENSCPVITGKDGRDLRVDEMEKCLHYRRWQEDFHLVRDLGIQFLRYGPPLYLTHSGPDKYDWSFADEKLAELKRLNITPIIDLCHFGVPDWIGDFQNPDWPELFAQYASSFARRFPWIVLYTPCNEIYISALFSGQYGWWNERLKTDRGFVTALKNLCRAAILAEKAILREQPQAVFIQSESSEYFHACEPAAEEYADFHNHKRFLSLDLCYGYDVRACMYEYLLDNGMTRDEYHWFRREGQAMRYYCVMGNDYYITNEHMVGVDGSIYPSGEIFGYYVITRQYYDHYRMPVMHTETNLAHNENAAQWLWKEWANIVRLREDGTPIIGFTWFSLTDQVDWDTALREDNGNVNPLGLYDLDRRIRPVGKEYRKLINQWRHLLPLDTYRVRRALKDIPGLMEPVMSSYED
jgi:beta-glucosidase